ncbi:MAG: hypothetical protein KAU58_00705, partial [Candidatus Omnitrophica bacterium]|nr:hypothetical protein [Candidatus Omnitrophota bacterium]
MDIDTKQVKNDTLPTEKPKNINQYKKWLEKQFDIQITNKIQNYYEHVLSKINNIFKKDPLWEELNKNLKEYHNEYRLSTGYHLFMNAENPEKPELLEKPFSSFLIKTYRKNILNNKNWPNSPKDGWILPDNWFSEIKDMVRTAYTVKYLDGVEFVVNKIKNLSEKYNLKIEVEYEAREEGYYAAHVCINRKFEIPKIDYDTKTVGAWVEIQITTQLQDVIKKLLHKYYEKRRKEVDRRYEKW